MGVSKFGVLFGLTGLGSGGLRWADSGGVGSVTVSLLSEGFGVVGLGLGFFWVLASGGVEAVSTASAVISGRGLVISSDSLEDLFFRLESFVLFKAARSLFLGSSLWVNRETGVLIREDFLRGSLALEESGSSVGESFGFGG